MLVFRQLFLPATLVSSAVAWGAVGHEITATIAQIHLHPSAVTNLCRNLPSYAQCHLAPIATWADRVRRYYHWSSHMHYIGDVDDHPSDRCSFREGSWEDPDANVLSALRNSTKWIQHGYPGQEEALKFLVHWFGDLHMPLHLTGRDRGGNSMKVRFDGRITNLHSVWDSRIISKSLRTIPRNYTVPLPYPRIENALRDTIYDPYIRQIMWEGVMSKWKDDIDDWLVCPTPVRAANQGQTPMFGEENQDDEVVCPYAWAKPIHELNCAIVWPPALDDPWRRMTETFRGHYMELDTPEYTGKIKDAFIIEKLLAMAGIRLAATLNYLFMDGGEGVVKVAS